MPQVANSHLLNRFIKLLSYLWCSQLCIIFELLLQSVYVTSTYMLQYFLGNILLLLLYKVTICPKLRMKGLLCGKK